MENADVTSTTRPTSGELTELTIHRDEWKPVRVRMNNVLTSMPYSGLIPSPQRWDSGSGDLHYFDLACAWLETLRAKLEIVSADNERCKIELDELRRQREVVRDFFGVAE